MTDCLICERFKGASIGGLASYGGSGEYCFEFHERAAYGSLFLYIAFSGGFSGTPSFNTGFSSAPSFSGGYSMQPSFGSAAFGMYSGPWITSDYYEFLKCNCICAMYSILGDVAPSMGMMRSLQAIGAPMLQPYQQQQAAHTPQQVSQPVPVPHSCKKCILHI